MTFVINKDALLPVYQRTLLDEDGQPVDLTEADSVKLKLRRVGEATDYFLNNGSIIDAPNGVVRYTWSGDDTSEPGNYEAVWQVYYDAKYMSYPNGGHEELTVFEDDLVDEDDFVFASADDVRGFLRSDVDLDSLALAHTVISLRTGVELDPDGYYADLDDQDKRGLKQATAIMAKWLPSQPDYFERLNVKSESSDGESRTYHGGALLLHPLAEWALANTRFSTAGNYTIDTPRDRSLITKEFDQERIWSPW